MFAPRAFGFVVLLATSTALAAVGVWDASSKKYGTTTVTVPTVAAVVRVTNEGKVLSVSGSKVTVAHEEKTTHCHKVASVTFSYVPAPGFLPVKLAPNLPDTCVFGAPTATFSLGHPFGAGASVAAEENAFLAICRERVLLAKQVPFTHPLLRGAELTLTYATGGRDLIRYPAIPVSLVCDPCPAITFKPAKVTLTPDKAQSVDLAPIVSGGMPPLTYALDPPPGMTLKGSVLSGTPPAGGWIRKLVVTSSCKSGPPSASTDLDIRAIKAPELGPGGPAEPIPQPKFP